MEVDQSIAGEGAKPDRERDTRIRRGGPCPERRIALSRFEHHILDDIRRIDPHS